MGGLVEPHLILFLILPENAASDVRVERFNEVPQLVTLRLMTVTRFGRPGVDTREQTVRVIFFCGSIAG